MELEKLTEKTLNFLRRYGHLDSDQPAEFMGQDSPGQMLSSWGSRSPYCFDPMHYQPPISGEVVYRNNYNDIQDGLARTEYWEMYKLPFSEVPDSEECVLVDVGSHLGRMFTRRFAETKRYTHVVMIDRLDREKLELEYQYNIPRYAGGSDIISSIFEKLVPIGDDIEETINELFQANNYWNVTYLHRDMQYLGQGKTNLSEIEKKLASRRVFFTGFKNTAGVGNITAVEAVFHRAEKLYLSNTSLERITPDSPRLGLVMPFFKKHLNPKELSKFLSLLYDPNAPAEGEMSGGKYDYNTSQKEFAVVLKQFFVLAQLDFLKKKNCDYELFYDEKNLSYNQADHYITAHCQKKKPSRS